MKRTAPIALIVGMILSVTSCGDDDSISCITCNAPQTVAFELCRNGDGNALVNGEDTGTEYEQYLDGLEESGASCGGN